MKLKEPNLPQSPPGDYERRSAIMLYEYLRDVRSAVNTITDWQATQEVVLFSGIGLNMAVITDQPLTALTPVTRYIVTRAVAVNRSGSTTIACSGGIYTGSGKTGTVIVGAGQSWLNLTAANKIVLAALSSVAATDAQTSQLQYLSLTMGSTTACTADLYLYGIPV